MNEDYLVDTGRKSWREEDFQMVFAFIRDASAVMRECPKEMPELASVLLDDAARAFNALCYIARGAGHF